MQEQNNEKLRPSFKFERKSSRIHNLVTTRLSAYCSRIPIWSRRVFRILFFNLFPAQLLAPALKLRKE